MKTAKLKISPYVGFEASGSGISNPEADSGYDERLVLELERVGTRGGVIEVDAVGLRDLAEWCDALSAAATQGGNPSGGRALERLAEKALGMARELEEVRA